MTRAAHGCGPATTMHRPLVHLAHLSFVLGLWLMAAPSVLGYGPQDPAWNDVAVGAVLALLALVQRESADAVGWPGWLDGMLGVWLVSGAAWLNTSSDATVNDLAVGLLAVLVGVCAVVLAPRAAGARQRQDRGSGSPRPLL